MRTASLSVAGWATTTPIRLPRGELHHGSGESVELGFDVNRRRHAVVGLLGFIAAKRATRLARNAIGHRRHSNTFRVDEPNCTKFTPSVMAYLMMATRSPDMAASCGPQLDQSCWPPTGMSKCPLCPPTAR